jgi:Flp pilus assembly protein TadD
VTNWLSIVTAAKDGNKRELRTRLSVQKIVFQERGRRPVSPHPGGALFCEQRTYRYARQVAVMFGAGDTRCMTFLRRIWRRTRVFSRLQVRRLQPGADRGDMVDAFNLALALERLGDDEAAERWYRQVAGTGDVDAMSNLGLLLARTGRWDEALSYLRIAVERGDSEAAYNSALICEETGNSEGMRYWYTKAAAMGDDDAVAWLQAHPGGSDVAS